MLNVKWELPLAGLLPALPPNVAGHIKEVLGSDVDPAEAVVCRRACADAKGKLLAPQDREVVHYVSTRDLDRDGEVMDPDGAILAEFKLAPQVLWNHNYSLPPVGSDRTIEKDGYGILAVTRYATTQMGEDLWTLRKEGHLNTASVGFIPMKRLFKGDEGWKSLTEKLATKWEMAVEEFEKVGRIVTKWLLLEHSDVSMPANIYARTVAVAKGLALREALPCVKSLELQTAFYKTALELIGEDEPHQTTSEEDEHIEQKRLEAERVKAEAVKLASRIIRVVRDPERVMRVVTPGEIERQVEERLLVARGRLESR